MRHLSGKGLAAGSPSAIARDKQKQHRKLTGG